MKFPRFFRKPKPVEVEISGLSFAQLLEIAKESNYFDGMPEAHNGGWVNPPPPGNPEEDQS